MVADQFIVDRAGKFSIVGVYDRVTAPAFPAIHPQMSLVTLWQGEAGASFMTQMRLRAPDQSMVLTSPLTSLSMGSSGRAWTVNLLQQTQFSAAGKYRFELLVNDEVVSSLELILVKAGGKPNVPAMPQSADIKMLN
jgi:hypothetical protein